MTTTHSIPSDELDPIRIIDFKVKDLSLGVEGKLLLVSASKYLLDQDVAPVGWIGIRIF